MSELAIAEPQAQYLSNVFQQQAVTRSDIEHWVYMLNEMPGCLGKDPFPVKHDLREGFYRREIKVPAGHYIAGAIHKKESYVIMLKGKVVVAAEGGVKTVTGPCTFTAPAGQQKIGYVIEDMVWLDIHKTDARTIEEAETDLFADTYGQLDRDDYALLLDERGLTEEQARAIVEDERDMYQNSLSESLELQESPIEGMGVFTKYDFDAGQFVAVARLGKLRTIAGRYVNHSPHPNTLALCCNSGINFVAINKISEGEEITVNYRQAQDAARQADQNSREVESCHQ